MNTPLLIGLSARIYTPGSAGVDLPGVWTKTLHVLEQCAAHWVMSGGALAVMVPPPQTDGGLAHYAQALDGLVLQGGNDVAPAHYGEDPLHPDWQGAGLGRALQNCMVQHAMKRGLRGFVSDVLPGNTRMLRLARNGSPTMQIERSSDSVHLTQLF